MHAAAEAQRLDVGARHVEPVGVGEARRIVITRAQQGEDLFAGGDGRTADLNAGFGDPVHQLRRAVVAQELIRKICKQRSVAAQQVELLRLAQQPQQSVTKQVGGGFETGAEEQRRERDQLIV